MKPKYIIGGVAVVFVLAIVGIAMTRHNSQTNPYANTPNTVNTASHTQAAQAVNHSSNTPPSGPHLIFHKGKIGDSFDVFQGTSSEKMRLRLIQIIDPYKVDEIAAIFKITNTGTQPIDWYSINPVGCRCSSRFYSYG